MRLLLLAIIGLCLLALAALVLISGSARPAEVAYANDDYQVPAPELNPPQIPFPQSLDQARQWLQQNALYGQAHRLRSAARCLRSTSPRRTMRHWTATSRP